MRIDGQASRQDTLYQEAMAVYKNALERLVRAYEANPDKQGDLLQDVHLALLAKPPKLRRAVLIRHRSIVIPLGVLMILIAVFWYARMRWQAPKIQRELDDLRHIRSASSEG
jgi:hypothetical protein